MYNSGINTVSIIPPIVVPTAVREPTSEHILSSFFLERVVCNFTGARIYSYSSGRAVVCTCIGLCAF